MALKKRCGCVTRCDHPWHIEFMVNRQPFRKTSGTPDKRLARDIETEMRSRAIRGIYKLPQGQTTTLREFWPTYASAYAAIKQRISTQTRNERCWRALDPVLGARVLADITGEAMGKFASGRLGDGCMPGNVNRELAVLSGVLAKAVEWGYIPEKPAIPFLDVKNGRTRILSPEELERLLGHYQGHPHYDIVALLVITAAREGEVLNLRWEDLGGGNLVFRETKNGHPRILPMTPDIENLLANRRRISPYVFPAPKDPRKPIHGNTFYTTFKRAVRKLELGEDVCVHTLRHTGASRMVAHGNDLRAIQEVLGHSNLAMLQRYTHPLEEAKRRALSTPFTLAQSA